MINLGLLSDWRAEKSLSPAMHAAALSALKIKGQYTAMELLPDNIKEALRGLWSLNFSGLNITVPYKEAVMPYLSGLSPEAKIIGAVNTLVRNEKGYQGFNTDAAGFLASLPAQILNGPQKALVFGAGGASRAILYALTKENFTVYLAGRNPAKTEKLAAEFGVELCDLNKNCHEIWPLIVNCSAASSAVELAESLQMMNHLRLDGQSLMVDINYGRSQNSWQELAQKFGAQFQDGLSMLAAQAQASFQLWLGQAPAVNVFYQALTQNKN